MTCVRSLRWPMVGVTDKALTDSIDENTAKNKTKLSKSLADRNKYVQQLLHTKSSW